METDIIIVIDKGCKFHSAAMSFAKKWMAAKPGDIVEVTEDEMMAYQTNQIIILKK